MKTVKKIDIHVHCIDEKGPERLRGETWPTPDELRHIYDVHNIEFGVEMSRYAPECAHDPIDNRAAHKVVKENPSLLKAWFCSVDPRYGTNSPKDNLSYYINYFKQQGAVGVGELQASMMCDDPRMINLLRHCAACDMPAVFHLEYDGAYRGLYVDKDLEHLDNVLTLVPDAIVHGHASAFWNNFPCGKVEYLMDKHPNLRCDLSAGSGNTAMTDNIEHTAKFLEKYNDRIYYGTDIRQPSDIDIFFIKTGALIDELYLSGRLSETAYLNICRNNALRLLNK